MKRQLSRMGGLALAAMVFCGALAAQEQSPSAPSPGAEAQQPADVQEHVQDQMVQAIWKEQEISFYFQSFTTFYSCTGLETKLERILRALGVHEPRVRVRSADCPTRVARMPRVVITALSPVEATPEAIAEREKSKSTRELAARVRRKRTLGDEADQFPAQWRRVSLSRGALDLEPGDCELIDELKRKVLPKLAVRVIEDDVHCTPHQVSLGQPHLIVEALTKAPDPDEAPQSSE
ncbi:MAG TPA: hypothetical protein VK025_04125 [Steroidobacter sp.]|jgi:hypothetical protein|nr:hypothetical protein [Steroidobacteraceae bacterium]HLS80571.1 hypothetical protein [Steroidobacter sp.]